MFAQSIAQIERNSHAPNYLRYVHVLSTQTTHERRLHIFATNTFACRASPDVYGIRMMEQKQRAAVGNRRIERYEDEGDPRKRNVTGFRCVLLFRKKDVLYVFGIYADAEGFRRMRK